MYQEEKFLKRAFAVNVVRDVGENYLVVSFEQRERLVTHQLAMLNYSLHPRIIPPEERNSNNQTKLYYRLNSRLPLRYYLDREEMDGSEVIKVLDEIVGLLLECKNYFLYATSFLLHEDYIFINPTTREVSLIYLPIKLRGEANENFRELLKRIYFYCQGFPANLVAYSEERFFNLQGFREQIKGIKFSVKNQEKTARGTAKVFRLKSNSPVIQENLFSEEEGGSLVQAKAKRYGGIGGNSLVLFVLLQFVIIVAWVMISAHINLAGISVLAYTGIFLLIVAFNLLILKKLLNR